MSDHNPFEIHVHGEVPLRDDVTFEQLQDALKPLWKYAGAKSLAASVSAYDEEPGLRFDAQKHLLQMCWTVPGDEDFRQALDEMCMGINELAKAGAPIEVTFYDADFDEDEEDDDSDDDNDVGNGVGDEARDDFVMYFVGPTPAAIMQVQRDLLVQDTIGLLERHFDGSELGDVIAAVDKLFEQRFDALASSMQLGKPPRNSGNSGGANGPGHGSGRKPRHLH